MERASILLIPLSEAFAWFETGLQAYMSETGWDDDITRSQTLVLIQVALGAERPAEIARRLNITRQSVGKTIGEMVEAGLLDVREDPKDKRATIVAISARGEDRRIDARQGIRILTRELKRRIGAQNVANLIEAMSQDWGEPITSFKDLMPGSRRRQRADAF